MCSGDTTPTNRLTRHESHLAAVEEHVPSQTHDKPVWLARKGRGRVFFSSNILRSPLALPSLRLRRRGAEVVSSPLLHMQLHAALS